MNENIEAQKIIRNYFAMTGLYTLSASIIWGVNTLFLLDAGLSFFEVFIANSFFTAGMVLFEIPTGVLADTRGRRASFLLSLVVLFVGTLGYVLISMMGGGLLLFIIMSVILGLGYTFYSGAMEAWLVDALNASGFKGQLDQVFARSSRIFGIAMLVGTTSGGFLGGIDLAIPYWVRAGLIVVVFAYAWYTMHDIGFKARAMDLSHIPKEMGAITRASVNFGWKHPSIRIFMLCSFITMGFFSWAFYAWPPYFLELLGGDHVWVAGVIAALVSLSMIIGNTLVEWITRFCGKRTTLLIGAALVQSVAILGVALIQDFWIAVPLFLLATATMGVSGPVKQAYMHQVIPSEHRASVISFDSMFGNSGGVISQTGLGALANRAQSLTTGVSQGFWVGGILTLVVVPLFMMMRRYADPADQIVGEAGKRSQCPQGLPENSGISSTPQVAEEPTVAP